MTISEGTSIVRSARREDLAGLLDLYAYLHSEPPLAVKPDIECLWQSILDNPNLDYFVVETNGNLVATCNLTVIPNLTRGARPFALIENVVTHSDYRRRGFGTQVLRHALDSAWGRDCYKVMLLTGRQDEATLQFYEGAGFTRGLKTGLIAKPPGV